jgi:dynactin 1
MDSPDPPEIISIPESPREDPFSLKGATPKKPVYEQSVPQRDYDEALLRIKSHEARIADQRDRLRELDRLKEEAEAWAGQKPKLTAKILEQAADVKALRAQAKALEAERDQSQARYDDLADQVEMATLDKEMAEEQKEMAQAGLEALQDRVAELQVELDVLREEGKVDGGDVDRSSLDFVQLEKQNQRLKEALARCVEMRRGLGDRLMRCSGCGSLHPKTKRRVAGRPKTWKRNSS